MATIKKNVSVKIIDSNKVNDLKKEVTIEQRKKEVKNDLKTSKIDLSILDSLNLNHSLESLKKDLKVKTKGIYLLRNCNDDNKDKHSQLRGKQRNITINKINELLILRLEKKNELFIIELKKFIQYYKDTYTLNDFSSESFYNGNLDQIKKNKIESIILIIKTLKLS